MKYISPKYLFVIILLIPVSVCAQDYLIELSARCAGVFAPILSSDDKQRSMREFEAIGYAAEAIYYPVSFAGVGLFYSRDISNIIDPGTNESVYGSYPTRIEGKTSYMMVGLTGKVTSNRQRRFSVYGVVRAFKMEVVDAYEGFSIAKKGTGYSAGFGANLKLTRWIALNVFEISYMGLSKDLSYNEDVSPDGIFIQSGLTFQVLKKK